MRSLIWNRWTKGSKRGSGKGRKRLLRPSILLRRRRQLLSAVVAVGFVIGLAAGAAWIKSRGYVALALAEVEAIGEATVRGLGWTVREVYVVGRERAGRRDVLEAIAVGRGDSMLAFDPAAARARLLALGWIKDAAVFRRLPDVVEVYLEERQPLALWQWRKRLALIDAEGETIVAEGLHRFRDLPIVVGPDAARHAAALIDFLRLEPALFADVVAAVRVGGRRWNIEFGNGIEVNLPEQDPKTSWHRLARMVREQGVFERDIEAIDMRLPDRLVVRLTPEAAAKRRQSGEDT
jgi:cell division protein FtsQ